MQVCANVTGPIWWSVDKHECHSFPSTLFETELLVPCSICWVSWLPTFYTFSCFYFPSCCMCAGIPDAYSCIQVNVGPRDLNTVPLTFKGHVCWAVFSVLRVSFTVSMLFFVVLFHCGLDLYFSDVSDVEHLFMYIGTI